MSDASFLLLLLEFASFKLHDGPPNFVLLYQDLVNMCVIYYVKITCLVILESHYSSFQCLCIQTEKSKLLNLFLHSIS